MTTLVQLATGPLDLKSLNTAINQTNKLVADSVTAGTGGVTITGSSTPTLAVTGTTAVSGSNTGDQTLSSLGAAAIAASQTFSHGQRVASSALTSASNLTAIDLSLNNNFTYTLTEDTTLSNPTNAVAGQSGRIAITQASSAKTVAYGTHFVFPAGSVPTVSTGNGALDILYYDVIDSTHIACNLVQAFA
jgi:hypothetical protein